MLIGKRFAFVCGGDKSPVLSGRVCLQQVTAHLRFMHIDFFSCNSFSFLRHVASCRRWSVGVGCSIRRGLSLTRISHVLSVFEMIIKSRTVSLSIHPSLCMLTVTSHSALPVQGDAFKKHKHTHTHKSLRWHRWQLNSAWVSLTVSLPRHEKEAVFDAHRLYVCVLFEGGVEKWCKGVEESEREKEKQSVGMYTQKHPRWKFKGLSLKVVHNKHLPSHNCPNWVLDHHYTKNPWRGAYRWCSICLSAICPIERRMGRQLVVFVNWKYVIMGWKRRTIMQRTNDFDKCGQITEKVFILVLILLRKIRQQGKMVSEF